MIVLASLNKAIYKRSFVGIMAVELFIKGIPYGKSKVRWNVQAAPTCTREVKRQTRSLSKVKGQVSLDLEFILPSDKYPADHPYGPDLDNLLKRFLDALQATVLSHVEDGDGAIVQLSVSKREVRKGEETGVRMILNEL